MRRMPSAADQRRGGARRRPRRGRRPGPAPATSASIRRVARHGAQKARENCSSVARSPRSTLGAERVEAGDAALAARPSDVRRGLPRRHARRGCRGTGRRRTPRQSAERQGDARRRTRGPRSGRWSRACSTPAGAAFRIPRLSRRRRAAGTRPMARARPGPWPGRGSRPGRSPTSTEQHGEHLGEPGSPRVQRDARPHQRRPGRPGPSTATLVGSTPAAARADAQ